MPEEEDVDVLMLPNVQGIAIDHVEWARYLKEAASLNAYVVEGRRVNGYLVGQCEKLTAELDQLRAIDPAIRIECTDEELEGYEFVKQSVEKVRLEGHHGLPGERLTNLFMAKLATLIIKPVETIPDEREGLPNWPPPPRQRKVK